MLLNAALKEYLLECELRNYTEKTIKGYRNSIELLVNYLQQNGITDVDEVLPAHIKHFLTNLQRAGRKPSYINGLHKAFRAWFKYLQAEEYISANPMNKIGWAKEEKIVIKTFTPAEVQAMLNAYPEKEYMDVRNKTILALLFDTGIRCSELCNLMQSDVDKERFRIYGKGRKERYVAQSPYMKKLLLHYKEYRDYYFEYRSVPDNLFLSRTGRPLTTVAVERIVRIAGERAKVR